MISVKVFDETAPLEAVVLGTAEKMGGTPSLEEAYDPKSKYHIQNNTYPKEADIALEMQEVLEVLEKHNVKVYRPQVIDNYNQIFSRDIGFVIGEKFIVPNILKNRKEEIKGIEYIIDQIPEDKILRLPKEAHLEGGDVMPWMDKIFVGYSKSEDFNKYVVSRSNEAGVEFLEANFPDFEVCAFELNKSDENPYENALHLDCCFQPIGTNQAIIFPGGFKNQQDLDFLIHFFGKENIIEISKEEMYEMNSNVFSISPEVIISEKGFARLNSILRERGFTVEEVKYSETAKMEGLLRCSTLPLIRKYD
jgi:N-dimethylarginine dimethylaminohydrolase